MGEAGYSIAILYVCTGQYTVFWPEFFESSERYFLTSHRKTYFVFTDAVSVPYLESGRVRIIPQANLGWPGNTLYRFRMFHSIAHQLETFDFIFFLNANMMFVQSVEDECLPLNSPVGLLGVCHPGFRTKHPSEFTYERDPRSLAAIPIGEGKHYFMGGFNGGKAREYLELVATLKENVERDESNGVVAVWHDESHLNAYLLNRSITVLGSEYGYPEGSGIPLEPKIIIRDKARYGGHNILRGNPPTIGLQWPADYWARRTVLVWYSFLQAVPSPWVVGICTSEASTSGNEEELRNLRILSFEETRRLSKSSDASISFSWPDWWLSLKDLLLEPDPRALVQPALKTAVPDSASVRASRETEGRPVVTVFADERSEPSFFLESIKRWYRGVPSARFVIFVTSAVFGSQLIARIPRVELELIVLAGQEDDLTKLPSSRRITLGRMDFGWWSISSGWANHATVHVDSPFPFAFQDVNFVLISPRVSMVKKVRELLGKLRKQFLRRLRRLIPGRG